MNCILTSSKDDEGSEVISLDCEAFGFGAVGGGFLLGGEGFLLGGRAEIRLEISQRISHQKELCIIHVNEQINTTSPITSHSLECGFSEIHMTVAVL